MDYHVKNIFGKTCGKAVTVTVPGSKSITARALLIAALARGESVLYNAQLSDDCATFLQCLKELGVECSAEGTTIKINGCGGVFPNKKATINVGSAGTAARFLTAALAFSNGEYTVNSSAQMKTRPISPLIQSLKSVGANIEAEDQTFPLKISGGARMDGEISVDVTKSSQFLSALLLAAPVANRPVKLKAVGSHGMDYVDMTLNMMWSFGVNVEKSGGIYTVFGEYSAKKYDIEPDLSAACYFYAAAKLLGENIKVKGVMEHSLQGDIKFIELLRTFDGGKVNMSAFSDQALTLAAIAPYLSKPTEICGVGHIRYQECDRLFAMQKNLSAMGIKCEPKEDGIIIYPGAPKPAKIQTFGDHRVAMSFALTGLRADGIVIENAEVCSKTFKNYFDVLDCAVQNLSGGAR